MAQNRSPKVAFVYPRSGPHKVLAEYAKALDATHVWVDHAWYAPENSSRIRRVISAFLSAVTFPQLRQYDVLLVSSPQIMPIFLRSLGLLRKRQQLVMYHNGETLYFLKSGYYGRVAKWILLKSFRCFDSVIVLGDMGVQIYDEVIGPKAPPRYKSLTGTPAAVMQKFEALTPNPNSQQLLFIGHCNSGFRAYYKGLDVLLEAFGMLCARMPKPQLVIIGECNEAFAKQLIAEKCPDAANRVQFLGPMSQEDMRKWMSASAIYVHPARGEAFGTVITDAMAAGLVPVVSEWTGAKEAVAKLDPNLIVPINPKEIAARLELLLNQPLNQLEILSSRAKTIGSLYTVENGTHHFLNIFAQATGYLRE